MAKQSASAKQIKKSNLFKSLGRKMCEITTKEMTATSSTPGIFNLYVLKQHHKRPEFVVEESSKFTVPIPIRNNEFIENPSFVTSDSTYLVGYDIEFQEYAKSHPDYPAKLLSHQWYFNFASRRFGVILLTEQPLSTQQFVDILKKAIPCVPDKKLSRVFVYAYFSLIECGWMHPSMKLTKQGTNFFGKEINKFVPLIAERGKEWHKNVLLRTQERPKVKGTGAISWKVMLEFSDARNLSGGGNLKDLGEKIGIKKIDIGEHIKSMERYRTSNLLEYCRYGIIDCVIAAESHNWYANQARRVGLNKERNRTASYSSDLFKMIFIDIYGKDQWKRFIGYEKSAESKSWKPTPTHLSFTRFYYGGRNEAFRVGPQGHATYHDLRSAYPSALIMLPDYDISCSQVYYGTEAIANAEIMQNDGPFQLAGVICSFRFKENIHPIFPIRIDEPENLPVNARHFATDGLIFPQTGTSCVTWPELWVARNMNLLEELTIQSLVTFRKLDTYDLAHEFYNLLERRGTSDEALSAFYKQAMNYAYGKLSQGIADAATALKKHDLAKKIATSPVTSLPLAAYITGFCRAAVGELLQQNPDCFAITTDGFISPKNKLETSHCDLCNMVQEKVGGLSSFIGIETKTDPITGNRIQATGDRSLFLKTRGYLIVNGDNQYRKMAQMGAQLPNSNDPVEKVKNFLDYLTTGRFTKTFKRSLPNQRSKWRKDLEQRNLKKRETQKQRENLIKGTTKAEEQAEALQKAASKAWNTGKLTVLRSGLPLDVIYNDVRLNQTFDMKRIPVNPTLETFTWAGTDYQFVAFDTKPLNTAHDFHMLRTLAKRDRNRYLEEHRALLDSVHELQHIEPSNLDLEDVYNEMCRWRDRLKGEDLELIEDNLIAIRTTLDKAEQRDVEKQAEKDKQKAGLCTDTSTPPDISLLPEVRTMPPEPPLMPNYMMEIPDDITLLQGMAFIGMIPKEVPYLELPDYQKLLNEFKRLERGHETEDPRIKEELVLERQATDIELEDITPSLLPVPLYTTQKEFIESDEQYLVRLVKIRDGKTGNSRAVRLKAKQKIDEYRILLIAVRDNKCHPKKVRDKAARLVTKIPPHPSEGIVEDSENSHQEPSKKKRQTKKKTNTDKKPPIAFLP